MPEEYISREAALADFEACNAENPNWTPQRVKTLLLRQPAADVAEVVHGQWCVSKIRSIETVFYCSECKRTVTVGNDFFGEAPQSVSAAYPYCHCGAKMDGGNGAAYLALEAETTQIIDGCCTACGAFMDCCEAAEYKFCPYCAKRIV